MTSSSRFGRAIRAYILGLLFAAGAAQAGTVNQQDGVALKGYDPVAYFTAHKPVHGEARFKAAYEGATYWFSNAANRTRFLKEPAHYVPQYDGFCAFGVAQGHKADIDPTAFTIVGDRLYLNYSQDVRKTWASDVPGNITAADKNWPAVSQSTAVIR